MSKNKLIGLELDLNNLVYLFNNNRLPKKIILSGKKGIGKSLLARNFLYKIFKDERTKNLIDKEMHTNVLNIKKNNDKKFIEIDQIREIVKFMNKSSFDNKSRFIVIDDTEFLNINSSNALLKSLEEPNHNVYFFLIYNSDKKILDTIKSRCVEIKINLKHENVKIIVNNYFDENIYDRINYSLINFYTTPDFIISLIIYLKENNLNISETNINELIKNILNNKHYNKHTFTNQYLNYIIELFFYNNINITKNLSYKLKKYYYSKLSNINKFNLDYESFFLEFKDDLLSE
tara:strand:+ start:243 stop:1112 length:870 start_codon:yes stop_codon:yes gene_type:complete